VLKPVRNFRRSTTASAAVEFAFIFPIMLSMFAGVVEVGKLFQVYDATNRLASQYAIVYADCLQAGTCSSEPALLGTTAAIANIVPQLQTSQLSLSIFQVSMSGTTPVVVYSFPSGATLTASQTAAASLLRTIPIACNSFRRRCQAI
jgi:Flp pilus assembly protein TadG